MLRGDCEGGRGIAGGEYGIGARLEVWNGMTHEAGLAVAMLAGGMVVVFPSCAVTRVVFDG
jgi:hypothetical protein